MKVLEINQLALVAWALNKKDNEESGKKRPLRKFIKNEWDNPKLGVLPLLKRWLNRELRWDWFMSPNELWRCGIEPYASNPYLTEKLSKTISQYPKKPIYSRNIHERIN